MTNPSVFSNEPTLVKAPHQKLALTDHQQKELLRCAIDPLHFIENYVWIQHPVAGRLPFKLYDYQKQMIRTYADHNQVIAMCSRQLGKCVSADTQVAKDGQTTPIETLVCLGFKDRLVNTLEKWLLKLSRMR